MYEVQTIERTVKIGQLKVETQERIGLRGQK